MDTKDFYNRFLQTGKIDDYLTYKGYEQVYFIDTCEGKGNVNNYKSISFKRQKNSGEE